MMSELTSYMHGVSSWDRLGLASVGFFAEELVQCIRNGKEGRWERGWKERGRSYSLVREANRARCFLRLGVTDMEKRIFSICIPKGRGEKGGWASMVESLRNVGFWFDKKENNQEVRATGKSYVEVAKGPRCRDVTRVRVEVKGEEIRSNVSRLEHCSVEKWNPRSAREEDLERLGWSMASAWGLKGKLGLARLGKGRALLEFEFVEEARNVLAFGKRSVGGIQIGLERWSPKFGCSTEREARNKAWVRILGLPISLWVPTILKRVGEAFGGFLGIDSQTERMEELDWARVLIKTNGDELPSTLEIGVEEEIYALSLWWEISPSLKKKQGDNRDWSGRQNGEVRGDGVTRVGMRVGEMSDA